MCGTADATLWKSLLLTGHISGCDVDNCASNMRNAKGMLETLYNILAENGGNVKFGIADDI